MSLVNASNSGITSCPLNALTKITMLGLITLKEQVSRNGIRNESAHTSGTDWNRAWCCRSHRWHRKSFSWSSSVSLWVAPVGDRFVESPSFPAPENKASQGTTGRYYALKIKHHNVEANTKLTLRRIPELAFASLSCTLQWLNNSCSSRFSSMLERSWTWSEILWGD